MRNKHIKFAIVALAVLAVLALFGCALPPDAGAEPEEMSSTAFFLQTLYFGGLAVLVYYWLVVKPQINKQTVEQKFVESLKKGDEVVTSGGIIGRVLAVKEDHISVEVAPNTKIRVLKTSVKQRVSNADKGAEPKKDDPESSAPKKANASAGKARKGKR